MAKAEKLRWRSENATLFNFDGTGVGSIEYAWAVVSEETCWNAYLGRYFDIKLLGSFPTEAAAKAAVEKAVRRKK